MIVYIVGVPGSGKTYYAVNSIYNDIKNNTHDVIFTNINEFNFDFSIKLKKFDFEKFYQDVLELYNLSKQKYITDDILIDKVKELGYYNSYIVIDEAHNFFDTLDKSFVWLFSYHRHLYIDFLLITQNLALIETKYKKFAEYFIRAVPTSLQLFSHTFKYKYFIDSRMSEKSKARLEKIKKSDEVFDLYKSGDKVKAPNILKRILMFTIVGFVVVFILFKVFLSSKKSEVNYEKNNIRDKVMVSSDSNRSFSSKRDTQIFKQGRGQKQVISDDLNNEKKYYVVKCIYNDCSINSNIYNYSSKNISDFIIEFNCKKISYLNKNNITTYFLKCNNFDRLIYYKDTSNEKNTNKSFIPDFNFNSK